MPVEALVAERLAVCIDGSLQMLMIASGNEVTENARLMVLYGGGSLAWVTNTRSRDGRMGSRGDAP